MDQLSVYEFVQIYRDESPPSFTVESPSGTHAAWYFRVDDTRKVFGPYMTRGDAEAAACILLEAEAEETRKVLRRAFRRFFENQGGEDQA